MLRNRAVLLLIGYWVFLFAIMHTPPPPVAGPDIGWGDKVIHAGCYAVLAWLALRAMAGLGHHGVWWTVGTVLVLLAYGALDEWSQQIVRRTPDVEDWAADAVGILAGAFLWHIRRRLAARAR